MVPVPKSASQPEHHTDMVGKALTLLTGLGEHPKGASASELARGVGYPLSTAHRLLAALVRDGYAKFDQSTKRYSLGLRVFQLAQNVSRSQGFSGLATPILDQISVTTRRQRCSLYLTASVSCTSTATPGLSKSAWSASPASMGRCTAPHKARSSSPSLHQTYANISSAD